MFVFGRRAFELNNVGHNSRLKMERLIILLAYYDLK